jgi:hypothetical protein
MQDQLSKEIQSLKNLVEEKDKIIGFALYKCY